MKELRVAASGKWEPEEGRSKTTKLLKPCTYITLSKKKTNTFKELKRVKAFCKLICAAAI